jgi:hypothetical protein
MKNQEIYTILDKNTNERTTLVFKWTTSRGQDTYGYNICSLYVNDKKVNSNCGGGYDMQGTAFGEYLTANYKDQLREFAKEDIKKGTWDKKSIETRYHTSEVNGLYGLIYSSFTDHKGKRKEYLYCDGACGMGSMRKIAEALNLELEFIA